MQYTNPNGGQELALRRNPLLAGSQLLHRLAAPWLAPLLMRLALAVPFWKSGMLKWQGFLQLNDTATALFEDFQLHLPGGPYPYPHPELFAFLSGCAEIALPVLLVIGFGTRLAALALLLMTCIIQVTVPDGWPVHLTWAALALGIAAWGPGKASIDGWLGSLRPRH